MKLDWMYRSDEKDPEFEMGRSLAEGVANVWSDTADSLNATTAEWSAAMALWNWWSVILIWLLIAILVLIVVFSWKRFEPLALALLMFALAGLVLQLAATYPTPLDFIMFWA